MDSSSSNKSGPTILEKIVKQRKIDVAFAKERVSLEEMRRLASESIFPLIDFEARLKTSKKVAILAEVKRASPSKGDIAPGINAAEQGKTYALAGAAGISCLTEPTWFKGTLDDMKGIREAIDAMPNRPALLRKDFIIDEYQVYEARYYGADTLLLIVAALSKEELINLLTLSRQLQMEPLVEVNNAEEMKIALHVGSKVIGINNRNLHDFSVDLDTTRRLIAGTDASASPAASNVTFVALSGISVRKDVELFESIGARAVLVGESLMRAADPAEKIRELQGADRAPIVKICGVKDVETAIATAKSGADIIGVVFAESKRKVPVELARNIIEAVRKEMNSTPLPDGVFPASSKSSIIEYLNERASQFETAVKLHKPLFAGVFADQPAEQVNQIATQVGLDLIQLSGHEGFSSLESYSRPVMKAIHVGTDQTAEQVIGSVPQSSVVGILLDTFDPSARGGTGKTFNWDVGRDVNEKIPIFLAGGLSPENIAAAVQHVRPFGVDVSSGVEDASTGKKNTEKIAYFVHIAKNS